MHQVQSAKDVPASAVLSVMQPDGTFLYYEPGDELPPLPTPQPAPTRYVQPAEFRARFTQAELLGLLVSTDPVVKLLLLKVQTAPAEGIDLLSDTVQQGLAYLVGKSLLAAGRPEEISA